jgi:hypothetical protein
LLLASIEAGDEFPVNFYSPALLFLPLFTGVRGIGILGSSTSDFTISANFALTEFSEVRPQK